jgi:hypothetical protein
MRRSFFVVAAFVVACGGRASLGDDYLDQDTGAGAAGPGSGASAGNGGSGATGASGGSGGVAGNGGSPNGPVTTVTTGPIDCDGQGDCGTCVQCAVNGPCQSLVRMCQSSMACVAFAMCFEGCQGQMGCFPMCAQDNPDGANEWVEMVQCFFCDVCQTDCEAPPMLCNF